LIHDPVIAKETGLGSFLVQSRHVLASCVLPYDPFQSARIRVEVLAIPREKGSDLSPALCRIEPIQKRVSQPLAHVVVELLIHALRNIGFTTEWRTASRRAYQCRMDA